VGEIIDQMSENNQMVDVIDVGTDEAADSFEDIGEFVRRDVQIVEERTETMEEFLVRLGQYYGDGRDHEQRQVTVVQGGQFSGDARETQSEVLYEFIVSQNIENIDVAAPRLNAHIMSEQIENINVPQWALNLEQTTDMEVEEELGRPNGEIVYTELEIVSQNELEDVSAALFGMNNNIIVSDSEDESDTVELRTVTVEVNQRNTTDSRQSNLRQSNRRQLRIPKYRSAINDTPFYMSHPPQHNLGPLNLECENESCRAVFFKGELKSTCCHGGKLSHLPVHNPNFPAELKSLFEGKDLLSRNFRSFSRQYNNANAFASLNAKTVALRGNGPFCYKISGEITVLASSSVNFNEVLNPSGHRNTPPTFAELYFYDTDQSVEIRMQNGANRQCNRIIMTMLANILKDTPYARSYRRLFDAYQWEIASSDNSSVPRVSMGFTRDLHDDQRVYNRPRTTEDVAAVFPANRDGVIEGPLDFVVQSSSDNKLSRVSMFSKHVLPMVFPLFFPNGDFGWTPYMPHDPAYATSVRKTITPVQFYAHKLAIRRHVFSPLFFGGKLFQEFLVWAYCLVESIQMNYYRDHQNELRVESYKGLLEHHQTIALGNNTRVGNLCILPPSHVGGPRWMSQKYLNAISLVCEFGRPTYFITFTCNPKWDEIMSELLKTESTSNNTQYFQYSSDRPDLIARVFHLKLQEFLNDITKRHVLGKCIAYCYTIEEQKRGIPHAHCLFWIVDADSPKTAEDVDRVISAEVPSKTENEDLFNIIIRSNIHGPCGTSNPNSPCMENNQCTKNFPKAFQNETDISPESYPKYRRRDNRSSNIVKPGTDIKIDNSMVVPYNPFLSQKYNAHINVELCSNVSAVKYIFKYITKGQDYARINLQVQGNSSSNEAGSISGSSRQVDPVPGTSRQTDSAQLTLNLPNNSESTVDIDEISNFLNCRYITPYGAAWRLFEYPVHGNSHSIVLLPVHLKDGQNVYYHENDIESALSSVKETKLTLFFKFNSRLADESQGILYKDMPKYCHIKTDPENGKHWARRSGRSHHGQKSLGRIATVSPRNIELYNLRILLSKVKGPDASSFEKLLEYQGIRYASYTEAARARGLINDVQEWENCLKEAVEFKMPESLRILFVNIVTHCSPGNSDALFSQFSAHLSEDFVRRGYSHDDSLVLCLRKLKSLFEDVGTDINSVINLSNYPSVDSEILLVEETHFANSQAEEVNVVAERLWDRLNADQKIAGDAIISSLDGISSQKCFFIDGPGGSGKTFLYRALNQMCESREDCVFLNVA
jgi:hypothetical protein